MTNEEFNERMLKQASIGYAQSLLNRGYSPEVVQNAVNTYVHPNGLLAKRASQRNQVVLTKVYNAIKGNL